MDIFHHEYFDRSPGQSCASATNDLPRMESAWHVGRNYRLLVDTEICPDWKTRACVSRKLLLVLLAGNSNGAMATSASDYQQSDTAERSGFIVDAVSDDVGKGIFATKEFAAGETLFRERPLVSSQEIIIPIELQSEGLIIKHLPRIFLFISF